MTRPRPRRRFTRLLPAALLAGTLSAQAATQAPSFLYQGVLKKSGSPVTATCSFQFRLYDQPSAGSQQGTTQTASVPVAAGLFSVAVNAAGEFGAQGFQGDARSLDISVQCPPDASYTSLGRVPLLSTPYAASLVPGARVETFANGAVLELSGNGNPGVGLHAWGNRSGVQGQGSLYGVEGDAGIGVLGTSYNVGVEGVNYSLVDHNVGMLGTVTAGVEGTTARAGSVGVRGTGSDSPGVEANSTSAPGLSAQTSAAGTGAVYAYNTGGGRGVWAYSPAGIGVEGQSGSSYGVYGYSSSSYAGYFDGTSRINGNLELTGSVMAPSDARLKMAIAPLTHGLREILALRPASWCWADDRSPRTQLGVIAQEIEPVLPELVSTAGDGSATLAVNYIGLIPVLVKAMQEQEEEHVAAIAAREAEIARLEARLAAVELRLLRP